MIFEILVLDESKNFFEQLRAKPEGEGDFHYFNDISLFCTHVTQHRSRIACVFFTASSFKKLERTFVGTHKDLFDTRSILLLEDEADVLTFPRTLKRSTSYLELQGLIEPLVNSLSLKSQHSIAVAKEFIPIKGAEFVSGSQSIFDVFVKLSDKKYVKIVNSGDVFNPQRVNEYINKGVEYFYIPR